MLNISNLDVMIGKKIILKNVSLNVEQGEFCAITGPNGSGKTTMLRAIAGELPYGGSIAINGIEVKSVKPNLLSGMRGILPQSALLSFPFTVFEVVKLGLIERVRDHKNENSMVLKALELVGMPDFGGRYYQELSGGEQQRVQLARVMIQVWEPTFDGIPRMLFLDEPISSLDIRHQLLILNIANNYVKRGGIVVAVLHDLNLSAAYADKILLLQDGEVYSSGVPVDVFSKRNLESVYQCKMSVTKNRRINGIQINPELNSTMTTS